MEFSREELEELFKRALELKKSHEKGVAGRPLVGKTLGLIFEKPSTRTRISFEVAMVHLGGTPIFISTGDTQISRDEPVRDTARVLSRYLDCLAIRTYSQELLKEFAAFSTIPVINALSDQYHPTQILSDLLTVIEYWGGYSELKIAWVGDGNNVCHSWINAAAVLGLNLVIACPETYSPDKDILERAQGEGQGNIVLTRDPAEAVRDAKVIYTDVWASMGQEKELKRKKTLFKPFRVNSALLEKADKGVIVMHCLPAHRGEEISERVLEGSSSVVWEQSENKLHMIKAVLEMLMG